MNKFQIKGDIDFESFTMKDPYWILGSGSWSAPNQAEERVYTATALIFDAEDHIPTKATQAVSFSFSDSDLVSETGITEDLIESAIMQTEPFKKSKNVD